MKQLTLALVLVLTAAGASANQHTEKKSMSASDPLRQLDALIGKWQCKGMAYATPWFPEHPTTAEATETWILDGKWVALSYIEKKTAENPMPFVVNGYYGYDPEQKLYVAGSVDSTGGYATGASKGWNGNVIVYEGPWHLGGMTSNSRDTFTKVSANEITHLGELESNGTWIKLGQETCTRTSSK